METQEHIATTALDPNMWDLIIGWLTYNEDQPLIFTQSYFWVFFAIVMGVFSIIYPHRAARNAFLFGASLFFYYKTSGFFFTILLFSTIADWLIGFEIAKSEMPQARKGWLALSITINLFILIYFKYAYFFADSFNAIFGTQFHPINHFALAANSIFGTNFRVDKILLPVGISFFTFQTMSYAIDIYRKDVKPVGSLLDFGFYVSFFPQLVAGPIVRAAEFIPQLYQKYSLTKFQFGMAVFWILNGVIKKMFLADYLAVNFIDRVFANPGSYSGFENLMALYGYSLQVYADFSGYTDMAIGIALLMGFTLPQNFNSPYKADSVGNFWKRWHISLSSWLKDYLYIPMGGNRGGSLFTYISLSFIVGFIFLLSESWIFLFSTVSAAALFGILGRIFPALKAWYITNVNIMMTMLLGGLWHGASWNFVIWGALNGLGIVVYKLWRKISPWESKNNWIKRAWAIFLTFQFITFTRIWFRSGSNNTWAAMQKGHDIIAELFTANVMLQKIFTDLDFRLAPEVLTSLWTVFAVMAMGFVIHWLPEKWKVKYRTRFASAPLAVQLGGSLVTIFFIYQVLSSELQPFIYFQF